MAPLRSVFLVTRRDCTDDPEGRLEILEAYANRDAADQAAEAHSQEESAKVKFEVMEMSVKEGAVKGGKTAAASKVKTKKPAAKAKQAMDDEEEEEDDEKPAPTKKAATEKTEKKAIPKGKANSLQGLKMIFTGTFKSMDRKTCEATAKVYGADIVSDKKLAEADLIVVGERPGTKKVDEIKEQSLKTINEAEFLKMVETGKAEGGGGEEDDEAEVEEEPAPAKKTASKRAAPKQSAATDKKSAATAIEGTPGSLNGLDLLFTGTMTANRPEMEKAAVACGAKIVKKLEDTDYVILGVKPGPKKLDEIEQKKVKTLTEAEFFEMIGAGPPSKKQKV